MGQCWEIGCESRSPERSLMFVELVYPEDGWERRVATEPGALIARKMDIVWEAVKSHCRFAARKKCP